MRWDGFLRWMRLCLLAPRRFHEAAQLARAAQREDWARVIALIESFRGRRPSDSLELGYLGAAQLRLERYEQIVTEFRRLERAGEPGCLDALRPYFASALLWLERNEEALAQFERMEGADPSPVHRALRHWNHAIALYRVGRVEEARDLLLERIDNRWPRPEYDQARDLLRSMGVDAH